MRRRLALKVQPGRLADRIEARGSDDAGRVFLKVRMRARPEDGAANAAAGLAAAEAPGAGKSAVRVVTGGKTRLKGLGIEGSPELAGVVEGWLADERSTD
jgi:uncharacterized protein